MARAKRTDRAEARRRHRAELAADPTDAGAPAAATAAPEPARAQEIRPPGIGTAFRTAFRPLDLRGDLAALPGLLRHRSFLIPAALTIGAAAYGQLGGVSLMSERGDEATDLLAYFALTYFVVPPPVGSAFLAGFLAPRASWLIGLVVGLIAAICMSVYVSMDPTVPDDLRAATLGNAIAVAPSGAALFAAAAAWYRRFLNLANPNRGRRPAPSAGNKGRQRSRPVTSRTSPRRR